MLAINATLDFDTAASIAEEYNVILELEEEKDIMEEAFGTEEEVPVRYSEVIEKKLETSQEINEVAEKNEFWEPIRKLLARKKKEKWGYWDEIHIEEDDL